MILTITKIEKYSDINKVKDGINDKFGNAIQFLSTFFAGMIISFIRGWKLTLIILALSPLLFAASAVFTVVRRIYFNI